MQSWKSQVFLCPPRDFNAGHERALVKQRIEIRGIELNCVSVGPERQVKMIPLQELVTTEEEMLQACKNAFKRGMVLWRANTYHAEFLRLNIDLSHEHLFSFHRISD